MQIDRMRKLGRERAAECYKVSVNKFKKFRHGRDLRFDMMDEDMMKMFEAYMKGEMLCRNTTSFYLRNLRSIYNLAVKEGLAPEVPLFGTVYTGVDKTSKRAVTLLEIKQIRRMDLSDDKRMEFARDIFLFSFYTRGMAFVDIAFLRKKDVVNGILTYSRRKTGQKLTIKWKKEMQDIVDKYGPSHTQYILPIIVREDGTERRQYLSKMQSINRLLKQLSIRKGLGKPLTLYVARHSWASIVHGRNVPASVICMGMGHRTEATTEIYLSTLQGSKVDDVNDRLLRVLECK